MNDSYNRLQDTYRQKIDDLENRKKRIKFFSLGGTLIATGALVAELIAGVVAKPEDVRYYFSSNDASVEQEVPGDYTSKSYTVKDNQGLFTTFTFNELETIEPNVNPGYTYAPDEYLHEGSSIGVRREEINPVKVRCNMAAFGTLIGGGAMVVGLAEAKKRAENEEEVIRGRMRR
ncbi:MAG: hypothetical protein IKJ43_01120 [Bacilli bacterium]|nr:hypothetical protein [Bacilli bacterium]